MRFCKLVIQIGKNLIENKMPESHWLNECMERGAKLVDIAPEYNCPATKVELLDQRAARPFRHGGAAGRDEDHARQQLVQAGLLPAIHRFSSAGPHRHAAAVAAGGGSSGLPAERHLGGPSYKLQGLTDEQRQKIGDFCVWDGDKNAVAFISRDEVGDNMAINAALEGTFQVELADGSKVEVMPVLEMYRRHLKDYDVKTVEEISGAGAISSRRLAADIWKTTQAGHPVAIHIGEGINHYFHATLHNRAIYLPLMLTGNIGKHGAGSYTWAGNYKGALFQASPWSGPGVGSLHARRSLPSRVGRNGPHQPRKPAALPATGRSLLLGLRRADADGRSAQRHAAQLHGRDAHAHAHESALVQQREFPQPGQMDLQLDRQRAAQD